MSSEGDRVWARIERHAGSTFHQVRGGTFTYQVSGSTIRLDRTNQSIGRALIEEALSRLPVSGPGQLNDLRAPSYLYAILADARIRPGEPSALA